MASGTRADVTSRPPSLKLTEVDRVEVVVQERLAPPQANTVVRVTDIRVPPDKLDQLVAFVRDRSLPVGKAQAGFRAGLVSINRRNGPGGGGDDLGLSGRARSSFGRIECFARCPSR